MIDGIGDWGIMSYGKRLFYIICLCLAALAPPALFADDKAAMMAVISVVGKKTPPVYEEVTQGIKARYPGKVKTYKLKAGFSEQDLLADLKADGIGVITALGRKSENLASSLSKHYPVLMGAVPSVTTEGVGGVTYMPSSSMIVDRLHTLAPRVDNLYLIYNPKIHRETIANTLAAARQANIKVVSRASSDNKQTQAAIEDMLNSAENGTDNPRNAIWVVFGAKLSRSNIEHLIKDSWRSPVIPFYYTPDPSQVDRFPFIFLPDWQGMGVQLADMGVARLSKRKAEVLPLNSIKLWVNQKKSRHYGLQLDGEARKKIDKVYNR